MVPPKGRNPDVIFGSGYTDHLILMTKQAKELRVNPKLFIQTAGPAYPSFVESLKADALTYYREANALAEELLSWVERYTPPEIAAKYREPLSRMIQGSNKTLLRVLRYPPLTGQEPAGSLRAAAHGDINLLTILPAANEPGLQVLGKDGAWHDVPCDFGTLTILDRQPGDGGLQIDIDGEGWVDAPHVPGGDARDIEHEAPERARREAGEHAVLGVPGRAAARLDGERGHAVPRLERLQVFRGTFRRLLDAHHLEHVRDAGVSVAAHRERDVREVGFRCR